VNVTFSKILKQYEGLIGARIIEMMQEDWDNGEAVIAFETLLDNLAENDAEVSDTTKQELRDIAGVLGMHNDEHGKGIYW